jgi:hypothetical protein
MSGIQGVWFRCAYCGVDFCDACEAVDTHNDSHIFMAFKSPVSFTILKLNYVSAECTSIGRHASSEVRLPNLPLCSGTHHLCFFRSFAPIENPPPVIPYPVYR